MPLETRPLHPTLACEVLDLRLWEPLAPETVAELRELWSRRGVLVFRRQALSEQVGQPVVVQRVVERQQAHAGVMHHRGVDDGPFALSPNPSPCGGGEFVSWTYSPL